MFKQRKQQNVSLLVTRITTAVGVTLSLLATGIHAQPVKTTAPMAASRQESYEELSIADVKRQIPLLENAKHRKVLTTFLQECSQKKWFSCQLSWYDMRAADFDMVYHVKTGFTSWDFVRDEKATALYRAIASALSTQFYREDWDLTLHLPKSLKNIQGAAAVPEEIPARMALYDDVWRDFALDNINARFKESGITYDFSAKMSDKRAEWVKYLALVFAARGDAINTIASLEVLKTYAKINTPDALAYNNTLAAVTKYVIPSRSK